MATIYNSELTKELIEAAKLQTSREDIPNKIAEKVIPVMEVNPKLLRRATVVRRNSATNATSATIYTSPTDKDFYLTSAFLSVVKDATSTSISSNLLCNSIDGVSSNILSIATLNLTAQQSQISLNFSTPIKIDRGATLTVTNSTNVANITSIGGISGYTVEPMN